MVKMTIEAFKKLSPKAMKQKITEKMEEWDESSTAGTRAKYYDRWKAHTLEKYGSNDAYEDGINHNDPQIAIEWELCDLRNQRMLCNPSKRAELLSSWTPEMQEFYLTYSDEDGQSYRDLEKPPTFWKTMKTVYKYQRGKL